MGLLVGRDGHKGRERFAGRLTIPEVRSGHTIWLTGRLLDPQAMADAPRYMSLPGPRPLLGAEAIAGHPAVVGVEGSMDWLTLVGWGLPGFAALGGALSHEAFAALAHAHTIYLAFDRDSPGQEAARALAARLDAITHGLRWKVSLHLGGIAGSVCVFSLLFGPILLVLSPLMALVG